MKQRASYVEWIRMLSAAGLFATVSVGCSDDPNAVGIGVLPEEDLISIDTIATREATSFSFKEPISPNNRSLLVGAYRDYEARALIRFQFLPDTLRDATVLDATLRLEPLYSFGDSLAELSFTVQKIVSSWSETSFLWDSITAGFYDPTPRGTFSAVISDTAAINVPLDPSLAQEWLIAAADSIDQFGILLLPTPGLSVIKGFASFQSPSAAPPTLDIVYEEEGRVDTLVWNISFDKFVANVDLELNQELLHIQAGVSYRSRLRFDFSALPVDVIVHNATLELTIDRSSSRLGGPVTQPGGPLVESVIAYHVSDSSTNTFEATSGVLSNVVQDSPDLLTVNVTRSVQLWVFGASNQGILLRAFYEDAQLDLIAFFGPGASEVEKRPKLHVTFSGIPR